MASTMFLHPPLFLARTLTSCQVTFKVAAESLQKKLSIKVQFEFENLVGNVIRGCIIRVD